MAVDGHLNFDTGVDTKGFNRGTMSISNSLGGLKSALGKVAIAAAAAFSIKQTIEFGKQAVEAAANINAANSQVEQTFGSLQSAAESAMKKVADSSGILQTRLQNTGTSIYAFAKTTGMDSVSALNMMEEALQVTADSAAYYDRSLEDTAESLKSFLKGNFENDAALGLSCTETTRNAAANKLYGKSFTELSEAQKQLTLLQMVKDANALSGAEGQAAREADGWENVIGNLKEAWRQFLGVVGQPILSVAVNVVKSMTSALQKMTEAANAAVTAISELFGIQLMNASSAGSIADSTQSAAENYSDMAQSAEEIQKANENSLASFDKVNKLSDSSSSNSSANGISSSQPDTVTAAVDTSAANKEFSSFLDSVKKQFKALEKYISKKFKPIFKNIWGGLKHESLELADILGGVFSDIHSLAEPLKKYFVNDFTPYLQTVFRTCGTIAVGLFDSFNKVFSDIWNLAVFPILQNFLSVGLPIITQFSTQMWNTTGVLFDNIKVIFDTLWSGAVAPILGFISQLWCDTWQTVSDFWNEWGQPVFDGINTAITTTKDIILNIWETILQPIFEKSMETLDKIWTEHLQPLIAEFLDFVGELVTGATDIYNQFIAPIVNWLVNTLGPIVVQIVNNIQDTIGAVIGNIIDAVKGVITVLKGIIQFISGVFTGDWKKAWQGVKNIFKGIWDSFVSIVKIPINLIIGLINGLTGAVESAINWIIEKINTLSWDVPDWVPVIGGETFGFNFDTIDIPKIPKLATGGLATAPTLAMVGDNRNAKTDPEVISPLSKLQGMLDNGKLDEMCELLRDIYILLKNMDFTFSGNVDGKQLFRFVQDMNNQYKRKTGVSAF